MTDLSYRHSEYFESAGRNFKESCFFRRRDAVFHGAGHIEVELFQKRQTCK